MINKIRGNLLDQRGTVIVHCVNCRGVMGGGIARLIRDMWPEVYQSYMRSFESGTLKLGTVDYIYIPPSKGEPEDQGVWVANAAGQDKFLTRNMPPNSVLVDYDATRTCFKDINISMPIIHKETGISSVSFPLFGCGLAGGDWNIVEKIIDETIDNYWTKNLYVL